MTGDVTDGQSRAMAAGNGGQIPGKVSGPQAANTDEGQGWRPLRAATKRVKVASADAPQHVSGLNVGQTAFVTPAAGWAMVGAPGVSRLLYTDDGGATWTSQLAWPGKLVCPPSAFDTHHAAAVLGLEPDANDINGHPVGGGDYETVFASTEDAGVTWTVGSVPDPKGTIGFHFLTPRQLWLLRLIGQVPTRTRVARTRDGGATWAESQSVQDRPFTRVMFSSETHGLLIATEDFEQDTLYATDDGGATWTLEQLPAPPGIPATAATSLQPVTRPGRPILLRLWVGSRKRLARPKWGGNFAYLATGIGQGWSGPHRLPMPPTWNHPDLAVPGDDGRIWAASGQEIWVAGQLDGPWEHRPVPLPEDHVIADIAPVGAGVLWLTTTRYQLPGAPASGLLYRSEDEGAHWTQLVVETR